MCGLEELDEQKLTRMLTFANAAASIVTTRKGALRVMPAKDEVEALVARRAEPLLDRLYDCPFVIRVCAGTILTVSAIAFM